MEMVTVRELRNNGGEVLNRVARGEGLVVTRDGQPVAELRPVRSGWWLRDYAPLDASRRLAP
ncbi:type II toxin-antitoxin system Phd/YefM family antitoxin [Williamsia sp. CHRR-6]|uniref:type II toxin-antitoxin system Phd/YefM family antitoxin n=1 Tax=Williamsia sp. CHRR-6 TaxID=2835871 RepID=UPI0020244ADD|nr:type II toxin-antitoxin system prevent-host-death family antitoxin [Williamsia sp. CHRR-6]